MLFLLIATTITLSAGLYGLVKIAGDPRKIRRSRKAGVDRGPVPGYAYYPARALALEGVIGERAARPYCLEAFHSPTRTRLALSLWRKGPLASLEPKALAAHLRGLCERVLEATGVDVVAVEIADRPYGPSREGDVVAIFARDGRGWSGLEHVPFVCELPTEAPGRSNA